MLVVKLQALVSGVAKVSLPFKFFIAQFEPVFFARPHQELACLVSSPIHPPQVVRYSTFIPKLSCYKLCGCVLLKYQEEKSLSIAQMSIVYSEFSGSDCMHTAMKDLECQTFLGTDVQDFSAAKAVFPNLGSVR